MENWETLTLKTDYWPLKGAIKKVKIVELEV